MPYLSENHLLCWLKTCIASRSSSDVNSGLFLWTCLLPETKSILDELDESSRFVYGGDVGVYVFAHLTWLITIWIVHASYGRDHITDNELRQEKLYLALDSYGLLYQRIFAFDMKTSFKSRHFKLFIHIFIMYVRQVFAEIQVASFYVSMKKVDRDRLRRQRAQPVCFLYFTKAHCFVVIMIIHKKVDPLQFQTMSYSYPYDQKWQYFFVIFTVIKKKRDKRTGAVFDPGGLKFMEPFHYTKVSL